MGYVLIFNNETFDSPNLSARDGSKYDVRRLRRVFHKFNFRLNIVNNPTIEDIRNSMAQLLSEKHVGTALCLVVVVMTHGEEYDIAHAKDGSYNITEEIINSKVFQVFENLPKIVITQACKELTKGARSYKAVKMLDISNLFRFDSTFEGSTALRYDDGTPFIQLFCDQLDKFGLELDIEAVADKVTNEFAIKYGYLSSKPQNPTKTFTKGFEKVYFGKRIREAYSSETLTAEEFI